MEAACKLLTFKFKDNCMLLRPFMYSSNLNTITFTGDAYFDPVLVILKMQKYGVLKARTEYVGDEVDRVIITDIDFPLFQKVMDMDPTWNTLDSIMDKLSIKKHPPREILDNEIITIGNQFVSGKAWKKYWAARGKTGPESGWEIPPAGDIIREVGFK